ncbi:MAG TPA: hypothetical protein VMS93_00765 [Candidatus Saccharimonadales bacterium]|nr:hypothetical protein [Candidatus Saccharimonadales bacterium]
MNRASRLCFGLALLGAAAAPPAGAATRAVATVTDYGVSGSAADIQATSPWTYRGCVANVCSDAVVRFYAGRFYVVNRAGCDNIQVLDPSPAWHTAQQFTVGAGSNPHDIAFASATKAYVTRYDSADLWIVNPQTGAHTGTLSLAAFADADGIPEMDRAAVVGPRLFVTLQLLDRANFYAPTGPGKVVVIDTGADTVIDADPATPGRQAVTLTGANPNTTLQFNPADRRLYVGETGNYGVADGGIEPLDPVTLQPGGFAVREDSLRGDVGEFRFTGGGQGYAIVSDASFNTSLVRFDLATHRRTGTVYAPSGFVLADLAADDLGQVWVADRTATAPGVRVFDAATGAQETSSAVALCLPPFGLALDVAVSTGVPDAPPRPAALEVRAPGGALFRGAAEFSVRGGSGARRARLVDVAGRAVREWTLPPGPAEARLRWDGRAAGGAAAAPGVYWLRVESGGEAAAARVVKIG